MANIAYTAATATTTANPVPGVANLIDIARVKMQRGAETLTLVISDQSYTLPTGQHIPVWFVEAGTVHNTGRGGYVGGQDKRSFASEAEAREVANAWFADFRAKGWVRTR